MRRLALVLGFLLLLAAFHPGWWSEDYTFAVPMKRIRDLEIGFSFSPLFHRRWTYVPVEAGSTSWRCIDSHAEVGLLSISMLCAVGGCVSILFAVRGRIRPRPTSGSAAPAST